MCPRGAGLKGRGLEGEEITLLIANNGGDFKPAFSMGQS
jgi:hypothetical protein